MKKQHILNKLYSSTEVAKILGISRIAVFKRIQKGQLKAERIGRAYAIAGADILGEQHLPVHIKADIEAVVKRAVHEYGEAFRRLGKE